MAAADDGPTDEDIARDMEDDIRHTGTINWDDYGITDNQQKLSILRFVVEKLHAKWTVEVDESLRLANEIEIVRDRQDIFTTELDNLTAEKASVDEKKQIEGGLLDRAIELEQALIDAIGTQEREPEVLSLARRSGGGRVTRSKNVRSRRRKSSRRRRKSSRRRRKSRRIISN